jgi:hypothetical protein
MIRRALIVILSCVTLAAGSATAAPAIRARDQAASLHTSRGTAPSAQLRVDVHAYSKAFLGGHARKAYAMLSQRCRNEISFSNFAEVVEAAYDIYGPLRIQSYRATINGRHARVTYRYAVHRLDQDREPWVRRGDSWRNNEC